MAAACACNSLNIKFFNIKRLSNSLGLFSDAVRVFLTRVAAEQQLPFELKDANSETRAAMDEARAMTRVNR